MATNNGKGRSRKASLTRRLKDAAKKSTVYLVCISLIVTSMMSYFAFAADERSDESGTGIYSMTLDALCDAIEDAVRNGDPVDEDELEFSGSSADEYEKLFDTEDGLLYEIRPDLDEEGGSLTLRTFAKIEKSDIEAVSADEAEDAEDDEEESSYSEQDDDLLSDYNVTGNEEVIFFFINDSDDEEYAAVRITGSDDDIYQTPVISVPAKGTSITYQSGRDSSSSNSSGTSESAHITIRNESESNADKLESAPDEISGVLIEEASNNTKIAAASLTSSESSSDADDNTVERVTHTSNGSSSRITDGTSESSSDAVTVMAINIPEDCTILNGKLYDPVKVNGDSAVAFVTTLSEMGISYGLRTTAWEGTTSGKVVLNLGNGNGKYNFADYAGNKNEGTALRYTTDSLAEYADDDGNVTIHLPSDSDLASADDDTFGTFTVVDASGGLSAVTVDLGNAQAYDYKLVGWVNIATGEYYDVSDGATTADIDLDNENVFYADWIAATYDHGSSDDKNLRDDTVSTSGFVTMHMYDYNELFNLYSESLVQDGTTSEAWTDSGNLYNSLPYGTGERLSSSFIFVNDGTTNQTPSSTGGMLTWPADKTTGNSWTGSGNPPRDANATWGIKTPYSAPLNMLFDQSESAVGVHYVGDADYLFWLDDNGYYTYNSKESAATYNQNDGRFYVYTGTQSVSGTEFSCFLPYNTYGSDLSAFDGSVDYWFGMDMEVNFYLPNDTGTTNGNQSHGNDMVFNFSGDDDILIFIDDELVLDMSGIHDESFGSINFSKGTVTMGMSTDDAGNIIGGTTTEISLKAGSHDLKVYYLERGGYASNLEIQFNVASLWEYEAGDVQTITAEKTWLDVQGYVIDPDDLPDAYKETGVEVGLFDVLGAEAGDTFGYTQSGDVYTVKFTDDNGVARTYVYDASGETPILTYTEFSSEGSVSETYTQVDSEGRVVDNDGYVVAWLDGKNLHIRMDKQTLNAANDWYYAWELLDPDGKYEVLELSESNSYSTGIERKDLTYYNYWSIIGDNEIENSFKTGETLQVILTEAAQEASNTLGDTKDAMGWVIVVKEGEITTEQVEFSQIADLQEIKDESSGQTSYKTIAGVTSQNEIDSLGSGAIWYVMDAKTQTADITGNELEDFYLYCVLDGMTYYLTLQENALTVTSNESDAGTFCYDSLGELLVVLEGGSTERVEILEDGEITYGAAELGAARDDVRIYTFQSIETSGFAFTAANRFYTWKSVDADDDGVYDDSGDEVKVGDELTYKIEYQNSYDDPATVKITDVLDKGLTYVSSVPEAVLSTNDEEQTVLTWILEEVEAHAGGIVTFKATVNGNALTENEVNNTASVTINNMEEVTNTVHNPVPHKDVDIDPDDGLDYGDSGKQVKVGDTLTYKIDYFNGYETSQDAYKDSVTVTITDVLDIGLDFVSADKDGTYDDATRTITWVIENVSAQTGGSVTFIATVNGNALTENEVNNTASVTINNIEKVTNTVHNPVPHKDVDIDLDDGLDYGDSGEQVKVEDTLTYKIDYFNGYEIGEEGYTDPATVTITDVLDGGLDYVENSLEAYIYDEVGEAQVKEFDGTYNEATRTITWVISDVYAQTGGYVIFKATVNENALVKNYVDNTATVQVGETSQVTNTVYNPVPGKDVDANGDGEYGDDGFGVKVGDTITYNIAYFNGYDDPAIVTITDVLEEGLDFDAASDGGTYDGATRTITWTIKDVKAHTEGNVTFTATVNENALVRNEVENTATIQIGDDPDTAVETNTVYNPVPDKDVDADEDGKYGDSGMQVSVGDTLTYKIEYQNSDDIAATVTITDELDVGLDFVEASDNGTYDEATRTITWVIEDVAPHSEKGYYVTFTATVNEDALIKNEVDNTATVQVGNHDAQQTRTVYNPVPGKDVDADENGRYGDTGDSMRVGDTVTYKITYRNDYDPVYDESGEEIGVTVTITDVLDDGLTYVSSTPEATVSTDSEGHTILTWEIENVEAHTEGSVTFTATVNENALVKNEVENTATVQIGDDPDTAVETNPVYNPVPDKDVDADGDGEYGDSGMQVSVGDTLTYKIDYQNSDDAAATVTITDELDVGLDFISASDNGTYDEATRTITWVIEDVAPHSEEGYYVTFKAIVNEDAMVERVVENTAIVKVGDHPEQETNKVYNPIPGKSVDTDGDDEFDDNGERVNIGDTLIYKIDYENPDNAPATVTITDELDEGLDFVSASNNGTYDSATRTVTWVIEVAADSNGSVTLTVKVNENANVKDEVDNIASVQVGDHPAVDTNTIHNPLREYFPIDEEIVTDTDNIFNRDRWFKDESVNEYHAIEFEMTTRLPVIEIEDLENGDFTMNFHEVLDHELILDDVNTDFSVYIAEEEVPEQYYTVWIGNTNKDSAVSPMLVNPVDDDCSFHVDVRLSDLYNDGIVTADMLDGNTEITIFFFADLEGTGLNGSYTSTVWYQVYDGDEWQYTSNVDVVAVYTYEIEILKYDSETGDPLAGATFGIYYDKDCTDYVIRNGEQYTEDSGEDGWAVFYGLAGETYADGAYFDGTYYVAEIRQPSGYRLSSEILEIVLDDSLNSEGYAYITEFANVTGPSKDVDVDTTDNKDYGDNHVPVEVGQTLTYEITYLNPYHDAAVITVTDTLDENVEYVKDSASDGGVYDEATRTITWTLENVAAATDNGPTEGTVTFQVKVLASALTSGSVENTASVQVNNDDVEYTNTVVNPLETGDLTISKTVTGSGGSTSKDFTFTIEAVLDGEGITGDYEYEKTDSNGNVTTGVIHFENGVSDSFTLKHNENIVIKSLPAGVNYTVTETDNSGYTVTIDGNGGSVSSDGVTVAFTNYRGSSSSSGHSGSSSGGGVRQGTSSGPGADSGSSSSGSDSSSSIHDVITSDDLGGLPATGESNMTAVLMGLCAVFVVLLAALFYMRRKATEDKP